MNYYEILEVSINASKEVIKNAYRALSKKYHPDTYSGSKEFAEEKLKQINEAYETLIDENKRLKYDYENCFKIDPNMVVKEDIEYSNNEKDFVQEKEEDDKFIAFLKKKKVIVIISIIISFIIAFVIGLILAGNDSSKTKENEVEQEELIEDSPDKDEYTNQHNYYNYNTETQKNNNSTNNTNIDNSQIYNNNNQNEEYTEDNIIESENEDKLDTPNLEHGES